jgi:hypothetical protein
MKLTKLLIFCFLSVLFSVYGQAQDVSIKGKVIDENGLPIPGVSILIKGTTKATSSDMDGNYQLKADSNGTLVFSFVGYATVQEAIKGRTTIGCSRTIYCCRGGVFQNVYRFNIRRVQIINASYRYTIYYI